MMSAADALPPITEKAFLGQVTQLAKAMGYWTYHPWLSIHSERGWPDLALVRGGDRPRFLLAELKTDTGKLSEYQREWITRLTQAGVEVYVWRPRLFNEIVEILKGPGVDVTVWT